MIISGCIHVTAKGIISLFFMTEWYSTVDMYHIICPFICQWTFRLFPCLGYCEQNLGLLWWLSGKESTYNAGEQEMWVQSLDQEDPLGKGMATHSHILAWRIPSTGDWRATLHRIAKSWTRLKLLSMHACMNLGMHVPFSIRVCLHICPGVVFLDHMLILFLVFWWTSTLFSTVPALVYIPTNNVGGFPFLHIFSRIYFFILDYSWLTVLC